MSNRIRHDQYNTTLEAMIRKQIAWRDVTQGLVQVNNTSFGRHDYYKVVSGSFVNLVKFLRQVTETESYRQLPLKAESQPSIRLQFRSPGT